MKRDKIRLSLLGHCVVSGFLMNVSVFFILMAELGLRAKKKGLSKLLFFLEFSCMIPGDHWVGTGTVSLDRHWDAVRMVPSARQSSRHTCSSVKYQSAPSKTRGGFGHSGRRAQVRLGLGVIRPHGSDLGSEHLARHVHETSKALVRWLRFRQALRTSKQRGTPSALLSTERCSRVVVGAFARGPRRKLTSGSLSVTVADV